MLKFKTVVEYDGTNYHGWQFQPNAVTIQGEIEKALEKLFHTRIPVYGAEFRRGNSLRRNKQ